MIKSNGIRCYVPCNSCGLKLPLELTQTSDATKILERHGWQNRKGYILCKSCEAIYGEDMRHGFEPDEEPGHKRPREREEQIIQALRDAPGGINVADIAYATLNARATVVQRLNKLIESGTVRREGRQYFLLNVSHLK
jgi:hypothetical protein